MTKLEKLELKQFLELQELAFDTRDMGIFEVPEWVWDELSIRQARVKKILERNMALQ